MTNIPEHIFEEALERLRNGEDAVRIAADSGNYSVELLPLLIIAQAVKSIPKQQIPTPHKQFRFAEVRTMPYLYTQFMSIFRVAIIPASLVIVLLGGQLVSKAASNSLPGSPLYSLKRATETARLNLTLDEQKEANLHVELTQRRLDEVKKAIDTNNPATEAAAITALQEQTEKTFAKVPQIAAANALANNDQGLLNNLVAINKEQKNVLGAITASHNAKSETATALHVTKENDKTLARIIATVNEQTLADLPNKISITGVISSFKDNKITVEKNTFLINDKTYITDLDGTELETLTNLTGRVTIVGVKSEQGLIAKQISIIAPETQNTTVTKIETSPTPTVKGAVTTKPSSEPIKQSAPVTASPEPTIDPVPDTSNQAQGSFIIEPNTNQYAP